ncbi:glycosyltransferase family 4 protein [Saccharomonospora xinjiangensis]|uniref:Glycosyltransferase n=1 Tax=Saccharomonospora xinjiangensis XJ-54 TaxID=882086 RepID=I0V271_9PSEU|nr:glycosyltransferase family 4 protein [Saccharomonospora xinjiangensis]EID54224.1 glycosyltransferase [Saccharomonospora xinjiangensis XJ-54]
MRYRMWTPLPPERSGISDYSYELLEALSPIADVTAVSRVPENCLVPQGVSVSGPESRPSAQDTLNIYHMGNHVGVHSWIYREALATPGIVVLHDTSLLDFNLGYFGGLDSAGFREEVAYAHGPIWGDLHDPALLRGWPAVEVDGLKHLDNQTLTMERRLASASRGVIVHDPFSARLLRERYPAMPVHTVPSGAPVREDTDGAEIRARLGWNDDHVVFGIFGGFNRIKRTTVAVLAFADVRRRWPQARLVIAGHADFPEIVDDVRRLIAELRITDSVHLALSPRKDEFEELISATDAVLNLRWPTAGETSAVMMRAFGAGKIVITSDLPQHRHLDPEFCLLVPTEPDTEALALFRLIEQVVCHPEQAREAGRKAREYVREHASWPVVAEAYRKAVESVATTGSRTPSATLADTGIPGVNVFADARATTGLAESARRHALALADTGVGMTFTEFNTRAPNRSLTPPRTLTDLRRGKDHPIDLWFINVNEFQLIPEHALDRYTIAMWAWELPEVPDYALAQLPRMDELWVLTSFVADAFRTATDMPITVVPSVVPQRPDIQGDRAKFGLPDDGIVVLFNFSASSSDARKNPWAVIEAFRRAFRPSERGRDAHLVIKVVDLHRFPELAAELAREVASVGGTLISRDLTRADMDCLLATCDVYVSLHRSEGFGLGMAEAMAMGKPVIATGYGGNTDFMPPQAAAVVGYDIRPITERDHRFGAEFGDWYRPGQLWAEPDVEQAARWLRRLAESETLRRGMGARGAEAVKAVCSPEAVGAAMLRRLREIGV